MKQFSQASKETSTTVAPGVKRRILAFGGSLMMAQFNFNEGSSIPWHSHPHEQVSYVISGEAELYLEGQEPVRLIAGGSYYVPSNIRHRVVASTEAVFIDIFTPQREDFLGK